MRVVDDCAIRLDSARTKLLEQANHATRSWTAVDPDCERSILGILVASFEEPKEVVFVGVNIEITRVALDGVVELTNTIGNLLVADRDIRITSRVG